jgi:methylglutaconyl-CoA hydratase
MTEYTDVTCEIRNGAAFITLNRPDKRNALRAQLVSDLKAAMAEAEAGDDIKVVVLGGAGKDFCTGADLAQLQRVAEGSVLDNLDDASGFAALLLQIRRMKKPVIAAVHGRAMAGGAGLASACDLVIASRSASFTYTEVRIGFVPAMVMAIARRNLSEKRAFEILCTGRALTAEEAERIGFINRVCDDDRFESEVESYAAEIVQISGSAMALTKSLLYQTDAMTFDQALRAGVEMNAIARMTPDCQSGIQKFLSKG